MSLIVLLADPVNLCIAADTRSFLINNGPQDAPVRKLQILTFESKICVVALAGLSELCGVNVLDYAQQHVRDLFDVAGIEKLKHSCVMFGKRTWTRIPGILKIKRIVLWKPE